MERPVERGPLHTDYQAFAESLSPYHLVFPLSSTFSQSILSLSHLFISRGAGEGGMTPL